MTDGYGIPLGRVLVGANRHDSPLLAPTLDRLDDLGPLPDDVTVHLDAAVAQLRTEGHEIRDEDVARLSPLKDRHVNFLGRYLFNIQDSGPGQGLRPFRNPGAVEGAEDED